jgi:hypothetical protein
MVPAVAELSRSPVSPAEAQKGLNEMGMRQTETSCLKSVLFWLQEYWTEPDQPRFCAVKQF